MRLFCETWEVFETVDGVCGFDNWVEFVEGRIAWVCAEIY